MTGYHDVFEAPPGELDLAMIVRRIRTERAIANSILPRQRCELEMGMQWSALAS
jgi:hypothetical protein